MYIVICYIFELHTYTHIYIYIYSYIHILIHLYLQHKMHRIIRGMEGTAGSELWRRRAAHLVWRHGLQAAEESYNDPFNNGKGRSIYKLVLVDIFNM